MPHDALAERLLAGGIGLAAVIAAVALLIFAIAYYRIPHE